MVDAPPKTLSIMVPALNEAASLRATIETIRQATAGRVVDYEVLIYDDGSTDATGAIADDLARSDPKISVVHHPSPRGLGYCYRAGVARARCEHYIFVPGDNELPREAFERLLDRVGEADIVVHYVTNMEIRSLPRRVLSHSFTALVNTLFGLHLRYFNGGVIHRTRLLRQVAQKTDGFAYQAEILVRLLKSGATYVEVGCEMVGRGAGSTSAFKAKNVVSVVSTLGTLFWEVRLGRAGR
jgi:glycosyltransferase involved in cell wall biosynthesis